MSETARPLKPGARLSRAITPDLARPGRPRPVTARAVADLDVSTPTAVHHDVDVDHPREAVDLLVDRISRRMERLPRPSRRGRHGLPGEDLRTAEAAS